MERPSPFAGSGSRRRVAARRARRRLDALRGRIRPRDAASPSGQIVQQSNTLVASLVVSFAGVPATMPLLRAGAPIRGAVRIQRRSAQRRRQRSRTADLLSGWCQRHANALRRRRELSVVSAFESGPAWEFRDRPGAFPASRRKILPGFARAI